MSRIFSQICGLGFELGDHFLTLGENEAGVRKAERHTVDFGLELPDLGLNLADGVEKTLLEVG